MGAGDGGGGGWWEREGVGVGVDWCICLCLLRFLFALGEGGEVWVSCDGEVEVWRMGCLGRCWASVGIVEGEEDRCGADLEFGNHCAHRCGEDDDDGADVIQFGGVAAYGR